VDVSIHKLVFIITCQLSSVHSCPEIQSKISGFCRSSVFVTDLQWLCIGIGGSGNNLNKGCHNNIGLSNISVRNDSFCLVGFDKSRPDVPRNAIQSLVLRHYKQDLASSGRNVMYTIAQVGVVVFILDTGAQADQNQGS
jgi:hypothetical protein